MTYDRPGAVDEERAQVDIAELRDASQTTFRATRPLARGEAQIAREVPCGRKSIHRAHKGGQGGAGDQANTRDRLEPLDDWSLLCQLPQLPLSQLYLVSRQLDRGDEISLRADAERPLGG